MTGRCRDDKVSLQAKVVQTVEVSDHQSLSAVRARQQLV